MTSEKRIEFLEAQNLVLKNALSILIVLHPNKDQISNLIKKISSYPEVVSSSENYKNGINSVLDEIDAVSNLSVLADKIRAQGPGSSH